MRLLRILLKVAVVLIGIVAVVYFSLPTVVNLYLNKNGERIVRDMITRTSDFAGHEVHFGDIRMDYDFFGTVLRLRDVAISPGELESEKDKIRFTLNIKEANLTGFRWMDFLLDNSIRLDSAHLEDFSLESSTPPLEELEMGNSNAPKREGKDYDRIFVNHIRVNKLNFFNKDSYTDSTRLSLKDLYVFADELEFTREHLRDRQALFDIAFIQGYMDEATVHLNDYRNAISAKDLSFDTDDRRLFIDKVSLINKLEKYAYIRQFEKETDWMELKQGRLELLGIDLAGYLSSGELHAEKLLVTDPELEVFRDKRRPEDRDKRPKMIHEIVKSIELRVKIDTIAVENMRVSYEERPDNDAPRSGIIFFDRLQATIYPFTTYEEDLLKSDTLHLIAEARLMGQGKINLKSRYFLLDEKGRFTMQGSVGGFDLKAINAMVEPATRVALKDGQLTELHFNISANDYDGAGELIAKFQDLEIEILDKNFGHDQNIFQRIGSFLANKLVIKSQNPTKRGELKKGAVYQVRDQSKFIFNYWWQLMLSGLKSTIIGDSEEDLREKARKN
ncbi:MAG: DUF748 domain-containing protein [Lunatimonas sp.]|uniref:DUF748 domain-containing protein n=1 Tax=Lunatimonas sp. TaxID=2060141 RepID=UPI00263BBAE7|nr:DUF748 domain-containing protein [Lunatimonas sp.]MCC5937457.1 DUF748 domain-containing protein [Lunatimonas sp.]